MAIINKNTTTILHLGNGETVSIDQQDSVTLTVPTTQSCSCKLYMRRKGKLYLKSELGKIVLSINDMTLELNEIKYGDEVVLEYTY